MLLDQISTVFADSPEEAKSMNRVELVFDRCTFYPRKIPCDLLPALQK
jgi:hypothetical protein